MIRFSKFILAILLVCTLVCSLVVPAFAAEMADASAEVSLTVGREGDTVTATVTLVSVDTNVAGCEFYLNFDNEKLEYVEHTSEFFDFGFRDKADYLHFSGFSNDGITEPGILAVVTFRVISDASGDAAMSISDVVLGDQNALEIPVTIVATVDEKSDSTVEAVPEKEGTITVIVDGDPNESDPENDEQSSAADENAGQESDGTEPDGTATDDQNSADKSEQNPEVIGGIEKKQGSLFWLLPVALLLAAAVIIIVLIAGKKKK